MSENGSGWPPRPPQPLPPEYEPVHHEPGYDPRPQGQPGPGDSPWRRTQRVPRPENAGWHQASHGEDPRGDRFYSQDHYDEQDPSGDRFVPGFGHDGNDGHDGDDGDDGYGNDGYGGDDDGYRPPPRRAAARQASRGRPRRRRRFRWIAPLVAVLVIVLPLAVGGYYAFSLYMNKYHPADYSGDGTGYVVVQVTQGDTPTSLGPKLVKDGVVASSRAFVLAAEHSSNPNGLLPGFYGMRKQMKASVAYARLLDQKNLVQVTVTIPEGLRLSQIVARLGDKSGVPLSAYQKVLRDPAQLDLPSFAGGHLEGYLFPATYEVLPHETALGVLKGMVQRFDQEATAVNLTAAAGHVHLTPTQVIVMASLVEAEGGRLSDYPKIARVIYNRLARKMPLQLDSTVLYGLNEFGIVASDKDLTSNSPYNTYKHTGLPPGPIDSPGNAAIEAVLHPAGGNWLYFVTVNPKTGETLFTSSPQQFQQFRRELEKNLGQG